jgi:uncharacterized DUF497 family protein
LYNGFVDITWDDKKAASNFKKHGVTFDEAATVFLNPVAQITSDDHPYEDRMLLVGHSDRNQLLLVVYIERTEEFYRIISARKATPVERNDYEEGI